MYVMSVRVRCASVFAKIVESLAAFITGHVMEKMCLPCKLVLPGGLPEDNMVKPMQSSAGT